MPIHIVGTLSSGSAKPDDVFGIQTAQDVVVNDIVVFSKRGRAAKTISQSPMRPAEMAHSGAMELVFDFLYSTEGGRVRLAAASQKQSEEDRKGASSTATIIGFATFGIGGLFGHNLAHGKQKTFDEKTIMSAFVADNVHVQSSEHPISVRYEVASNLARTNRGHLRRRRARWTTAAKTESGEFFRERHEAHYARREPKKCRARRHFIVFAAA